jgi:dTDP-4-dehydrorhamnose 3,5-epimerase-like enzyme
MQVEQLRTASGQPINGPLLITPQVFGDDRGFFFESRNQRLSRVNPLGRFATTKLAGESP